MANSSMQPRTSMGAMVAQATYRLAQLRRPRLCYLQIPAVDVAKSVAFYEKVVGRNIRHRDTSRPSFDDATGNVSGAWFTGREISREPGLLPYVWVDSINATLTQAAATAAQSPKLPTRTYPGTHAESRRSATRRET